MGTEKPQLVVLNWLLEETPIEEELYFHNYTLLPNEQLTEIPDGRISDAKEPPVFDDFESKMIQVCIDTTIEKLNILRHKHGATNYFGDYFFPKYRTIDERFGDVQDYDEEKFTDEAKSYRDITIIYSILLDTLKDLEDNQNFVSFITGRETLKKLYNDENMLFDAETNSVYYEKELKTKLDYRIDELNTIYNNKLKEINDLEILYEDTVAYEKLQYNYMESWEKSKLYQAKKTMDKEETALQEIIDASTTKINSEKKTHDAVVQYIEEICSDMENDIQYWMYHYEAEIEQMESQFYQTRVNSEATKEKHLELKQLYEDRKKFIDDWEDIQFEKKINKVKGIFKVAAAVKIQRWWRKLVIKRKLAKKKTGKKKKKI